MKAQAVGLGHQVRRWVLGLVASCIVGLVAAQTPAAEGMSPPPSITTYPPTPTSTVLPARTWVSVGVGSQHFQNASQYNQKNLGLGLEIPFQAEWLPVADARAVLGFFRNSERARSIYAGAFLFPFAKPQDAIKFGALVGLINGYERANNGGFFPLLVPTLAYEQSGFGANLFLVPPVAGIPATFALQVKMGF